MREPGRDGEEHGHGHVQLVVDQAVQIHGGYGYMREYVVERLFRDARLYPIGGGTREIMNEIISKTEGY
ncbi:MAG TPA: acyl-CoA dehydrogenase family protein [Polyangiaceae bacterium]